MLKRVCVPSSPFLPADSVAGPFWNWRTLLSVISCTFFVANGRVGPSVYDRPLALGLALPIMAALSGHDGVGQAGHRRPMASSGLSPVLALALEIRTAVSASRS
jgi:hypothetical protein